MSLNNLGVYHITPQQKEAIDNALNTIVENLSAVTQNLSAEDRQKFGSVNEINKLLINKCREFQQNQTTLATPDVDWVEFEADYQDRTFADTRLDRLATITRMLSDFKIVHDYDNYQDALTDYDYTKYKSSTKVPGYTEKVGELKQFFPNSGGSGPATPKQ
ncbi:MULTISPECIES: hypothetical protein [Flavobacterium]|jgi:hypothetical protein|uniref:Uncharacterized protein n=1 Tax=Flavobacterium jumunjinense TaxID=998845 RepID=A0ABV5GMN1_9FLAO|nr:MULTISPECIES: hypothetical protein [Flavobacterium]